MNEQQKRELRNNRIVAAYTNSTSVTPADLASAYGLIASSIRRILRRAGITIRDSRTKGHRSKLYVGTNTGRFSTAGNEGNGPRG